MAGWVEDDWLHYGEGEDDARPPPETRRIRGVAVEVYLEDVDPRLIACLRWEDRVLQVNQVLNALFLQHERGRHTCP